MILAIETATPYGSVALVDRGAVLRETILPPGRQASETILSAVSGLESMATTPAIEALRLGSRSYHRRIREACSEALVRLSSSPAAGARHQENP